MAKRGILGRAAGALRALTGRDEAHQEPPRGGIPGPGGEGEGEGAEGEDGQAKAKVKRGRPRVLTSRARARILAAIREGSTRKAAARAGGVGLSTLQAALAEGRADPEGPEGDFARDAAAAEEDWRAKRATKGLRRRKGDTPLSEIHHLGRVLNASPDELDRVEAPGLVASALKSAEAAAQLKERALQACRDHLVAFAVHVYIGRRPYYRVNWHHRGLADVLEKFARGELRRLLVSLPPRHGKTELAIKALSAWILGQDPDQRIIVGAYSARLAGTSSKHVRRVIASAAYREVFPDVALPSRREVLAGEKTMQGGEWELGGTARGGLFASGLNGSVTGTGGGYVLVDDPCKNRAEAESVIYQQTVLEHYNDDWCSRTEAPDCRMIIATRWGDRDLIGQVLEQAAGDPSADQWTVINVPAILDDESERCEWDPREIGEPLWPELYLRSEEWDEPPEWEEIHKRAVHDLRQKINSTVGGDSLYQGRSRARDGGIFKAEWFTQRWTVLPKLPGEWAISCDPKASSSKRPWASYTVYQVWFRPHGHAQCYLVDERRGKVGIDGAIHMLHEIVAAWPQATAKYIERRGYGGTLIDLCSAPHAVGAQQYPAVTGLVAVDPQKGGDKITRAEAIVPLCSAGNVILPHPSVCPWIGDWEREVVRFQGKKTDVGDRVDTMSQMLDRWRIVSQPFRYQGGGRRESGSFRRAFGM